MLIRLASGAPCLDSYQIDGKVIIRLPPPFFLTYVKCHEIGDLGGPFAAITGRFDTSQIAFAPGPLTSTITLVHGRGSSPFLPAHGGGITLSGNSVMRQSLQTFSLSLFIVLALLVIGIGFMFGIDNPVPWIMIAVLAALPFIHKRITARHFVTWDPSLSVGIVAIDEDHKKLLTLINNLQTAVYYPTCDACERATLKELVDYTKYHFEREEALLTQHNYPEFEAHKREHEAMIARVGQFLDAYEKDREGTVEKMAGFLKTWLIDHIAGTDQKYSAYLHGKGVS